MSVIALLLPITAAPTVAVCLAVCLRLAYDLRRAIRCVDRIQRRLRGLGLGLDALRYDSSVLAQCDEVLQSRLQEVDASVTAHARGLRLVEGKVRDLHRRIHGVTDTTCYTLPEEVPLVKGYTRH